MLLMGAKIIQICQCLTELAYPKNNTDSFLAGSV